MKRTIPERPSLLSVLLLLSIAVALGNTCDIDKFFLVQKRCQSDKSRSSSLSAALHGLADAPAGSSQSDCDTLKEEAQCMFSNGCWPLMTIASPSLYYGEVDQRRGCKVTAAGLDKVSGISCPPGSCDPGSTAIPDLTQSSQCTSNRVSVCIASTDTIPTAMFDSSRGLNAAADT